MTEVAEWTPFTIAGIELFTVLWISLLVYVASSLVKKLATIAMATGSMVVPRLTNSEWLIRLVRVSVRRVRHASVWSLDIWSSFVRCQRTLIDFTIRHLASADLFGTLPKL